MRLTSRLQAVAGAAKPSAEGSGAAQSRWVLSHGSCGPARSASASRRHACRVLRAGDLHPKQQPFRRCQEKLPRGKSPLGSAPPKSCWPRTLAAGATAAGPAASAGARHKGRLCSRSPGCLPRAILLAPGRLPAPAVHTWAFHDGSGDDLLPGGRGRGGRMEPLRPAPHACRCCGAPHTSGAVSLAGHRQTLEITSHGAELQLPHAPRAHF